MAIRLVDELRRRTDDELAGLLAARPDLAVPVPDDLAALASRAQSRLSLARALEGLDLFTLEILDALRLATQGIGAAPGAAEGTARLADVLALAAPVDAGVVRAAVDRLRALAVAYGPDEAICVARTVDELCSAYPAGLGRPAAELDPAAGELMADPALLRRELLRTPPEARAVLDRLAAGPPVGTVRAGAGNDTPDTPVFWLIRHGLLVQDRIDTVQLPRELGLLLRRDIGPLGATHPDPPEIDPPHLAPDAVDAAGAGQVMEVIRITAALADALTTESAAVLRSGGIGVRDLRRLARDTGVTESVVALLLEVAHHAGLLAGTEKPGWLPTPEYDQWKASPPAERWQQLATAWRAMPRSPGLVGGRDMRDKPITALSGEVSRMAAPVLREATLAALADLPPGSAPRPDDLIALLAWRTPRRAGGWLPRTGEEAGATNGTRWALSEAATLGITGRGALTGHGRALFADEAVVDLLDKLLPAPVTEMLLQADLTIVVPGPPETDLAAELNLVADTESAGQATVYRLTPQSVRRALDAGMSAGDLHGLLARRSATPVPQAVSYLVDDVARRHGGLRVGRCGSYVRADDVALLAEVAADRRLSMLGLRQIAPTVLVSRLHPDRLLELLRGAGYPPVVEDGDGVVLVARPQLPRAEPATYLRRSVRELPDRLSDQAVTQVLAALRRGEKIAATARRAPAAEVRSTADALGVITEAIRAQQLIWVGYVDAHGGTAARLVRPVSIGAGYLRAADDRTETLHTFALHRITSATPAD